MRPWLSTSTAPIRRSLRILTASESLALGWPTTLWPEFVAKYDGFATETYRTVGNRLAEFRDRVTEMLLEGISTRRARLAILDITGVQVVDTQVANAIVQAAKDVILFLGANPFKSLALELDREVTEVSEGLKRFGKRDAFDFRAKIHVTPTDLQRMLLEASGYKPRFVHFAGNAVVDHPDYGSGVIFEDDKGQPRTVSGEVLAMIFRQFPSVECVFLNTCDSGPSALAIGKHLRYAIGMNARVFDESAIVFAVAFYEAIAGGNDVPFAFEFARTRLLTEQYPEQASIPVLVTDGQCPDPVYVSGESHVESAPPRPRIMR